MPPGAPEGSKRKADGGHKRMPESKSPAVEAESKSKAVAWQIGATIFLAVLTAIGNVLASIAPQLTEIALTLVPAWASGYVGPAIASGVAAVSAWLLKRAKTNSEKAVEAAGKATPNEFESYYHK